MNSTFASKENGLNQRSTAEGKVKGQKLIAQGNTLGLEVAREYEGVSK